MAAISAGTLLVASCESLPNISSRLPTDAPACEPIVGRVHGDPELPDEIRIDTRDGRTLTAFDSYDLVVFVFDPALRVVSNDRSETLAVEGVEYEIGIAVRAGGRIDLCGDFIDVEVDTDEPLPT